MVSGRQDSLPLTNNLTSSSGLSSPSTAKFQSSAPAAYNPSICSPRQPTGDPMDERIEAFLAGVLTLELGRPIPTDN
jgi:hypothetical protein